MYTSIGPSNLEHQHAASEHNQDRHNKTRAIPCGVAYGSVVVESKPAMTAKDIAQQRDTTG